MGINTEVFDKVVDRAAMISRYEKAFHGKISTILDGHSVNVERLIRDAELSPKGFERLREAVDQELQRTYKEAYQVSKRTLLDLFSDQLSYTYQLFDNAVGKIWRTERPHRVAEELVLNTPLVENNTLIKGWGGVSQAERVRIEALLRKGIAEGKSSSELALEVRKGNIHSISMNQSKALVTTAVTAVTAEADQAVYEANEKVLVGWQYVAILDSRTSYICAHRNGTIYPPKDRRHLPPAHYRCRSKTVPVFKSWEDVSKLEGAAQVRKRNLDGLSEKQKALYDGLTPMKESYGDWLRRQPMDVKLRHLGDYKKVELFDADKLAIEKFADTEGKPVGIRELRAMTEATLPGETRRFASAKAKLDAMQLGVSTPEDLDDPVLRKTLVDYYKLQAGELDGTLSLTNYRGQLIHVKKATKNRVLNSPPTEEQMRFNPITSRYEDVRMYQPSTAVLGNAKKLLEGSEFLTKKDVETILAIDADLEQQMNINQRAVVMDNLRILFTRYRKNPEPWVNFKAAVQAQIKFDVTNISEYMETQLRKDANPLKKLLDSNYIDPMLGPVQLDHIHDTFIDNIIAKNRWQDTVAPKIAREMRDLFDRTVTDRTLLRKAPVLWDRLSERDLQQFYLRFTHRLSLADAPDRDQLAVDLGRDLYNLANMNGSRRKWFELGLDILESDRMKKFYELETFGVQKRRMKSRLSANYFGPYYDTTSYNIRLVDPRLQEYAKLSRKVDLGLRVSVVDDRNRLVIREGYKTYFIDKGGIGGLVDTRIPITSTTSYGDFPVELIDGDMARALNWTAKARYRIDEDYYDFINKLLYFEDDRGNAKHFNELNEYRKFIVERSDSYERFKTMEWLRKKGASFSNHPFVDHRARIYDRGLIGPQSGETFRPFLNTEHEVAFSREDFMNFRDQVGAFLGGASDKLEGNYNSLSFSGRQKIAQKHWDALVGLGENMLRGKPGDIRAVLESELAAEIDGEELGKFYRFAIESAKLDRYLKSVDPRRPYGNAALEKLTGYKTGLALEQDASSSGAQIIALTTRNKQLAELSNVVPTYQKRRLYDEIAADTFHDPRFIKLNAKLGLTEKDLRKAAKAQNMVTFYGAGERTGALNVEGKLAKVLGKEAGTLVVKAADRETVLNEISARIAKYEQIDPLVAAELRTLRENVKNVFNKGVDPGDDLLEELYFLDSRTFELVEKMSRNYDKVVTPTDFKEIAAIMSEHLGERVPILKDFTKFFGRLAEAYLENAKPSESDFDWKAVAKTVVRGEAKRGYVLDDRVSELLGIKAGEPVSEKFLRQFGWWKPNGTLAEIINGIPESKTRRTGAKYMKLEIAQTVKLSEVEVFYANKLPKSWTNVPWVNFDGKVVEQHFTQKFEERLSYKNVAGEWVNNILKVPQRTEATWWEQVINKDGKIRDIADVTKARTAFAVNGNHSNDAVIVKQFHLWGAENGVPTSTVHDAFFANAAQMRTARTALRRIYAKSMRRNVIEATLEEMRARGLPREIYEMYYNEAVEKGLIPIPGKSKINGRILREEDILTPDDVLKEIPEDFTKDFGWYGVG